MLALACSAGCASPVFAPTAPPTSPLSTRAATGRSADANTWAALVDTGCRQLYVRSTAPRRVGDADEQIAVDVAWMGDLMDRAADALADSADAPADEPALLQDMRAMASLERDLAEVYHHHGLSSARLGQDKAALKTRLADFGRLASASGIPSCAEIADLGKLS